MQRTFAILTLLATLGTAQAGKANKHASAKGKSPAAFDPSRIADSSRATEGEILAMAACPKQIAETLKDWAASKEFHFGGFNMDGGKIFRGPTKEIGIWVELRVYHNKMVDAIKTSAYETLQATWSLKNCTPAIKTDVHPMDPQREKISFTDAKLKELLSSGKAGMIYVWSPGMPLSLNGVVEAVKVGQAHGLVVTPIVDPYAEAELAKDKIKAMPGFQPEWLRPLESLDLLMRDMAMHFPSLVLYKNGAIVSPMLPGYLAPEELSGFIDAYIN